METSSTADPLDYRLAEAREAVERGWVLTPLRGKRPLKSAWQKADVPDLETVERWALAGNVGLRTGQISGIVVIDDDTADRSAATTLDLPDTVTAITGSGGRHYYFRCPDGGVSNSSGKLATEVDVKGDRGQVVYPGSVHPDTGEMYRWADGLSPDDVPIAAFPPPLLAKIQANPHLSEHPESSEIADLHEHDQTDDALVEFARLQLSKAQRRVAEAASGTRNDTLNREAFRLGRYVASGIIREYEVRGTLWGAALSAGLPQAEAKRTLDSALSARHARALDKDRLRDRLARAGINLRQQGTSSQEAYELLADARRPGIDLAGGALHRSVDRLDEVISSHSPPILFQRGNSLVRIVYYTPPVVRTGIERPRDSIILHAADSHFVTDLGTRLARFLVPSAKGPPKQVDCPDKIAKTYLARAQWSAPQLLGYTEAPTLRADGSLLQQPGYDPASRLYFAPNDTFPPVSDSPPAHEVRQALETVMRPFDLFPFVDDCDRSVLLAAILTAISRRTLRSAPAFPFRAPTISTGKSLLAESVSVIATGRLPAMMSQGKDEDEDRKRILGLLLAGDLVVVIDNIERPLDSPALASVLTQELYRDRILGKSKTVVAPTQRVLASVAGTPRESCAGLARPRRRHLPWPATNPRPW